jgi:hypothetical protein
MSDTLSIKKGTGTNMTEERLQAIREELCEVESLAELDAMVREFPDVYGDELLGPMVRSTASRLELFGPIQGVQAEPPVQPSQLDQPVEAWRIERSRGTKKYQLLNSNITWTQKPQVHALAAILAAHIPIGGVADEQDIIRAVVANEGLLKTKQGGERIWKYYRGDHAQGLEMHGNIKEVK